MNLFFTQGLNAIRQLKVDAIYANKKGKFPVCKSKCVNLPKDYLNFTKVGIVESDGTTKTLDTDIG